MIDAAHRGAVRELEGRLRPFVARRVNEADVDDVVQDVFLRMHRGLGGLQAEERFGPWIYSVARSAIADHRRAMRRRPVPGAAPEPELVDEVEDDDPPGASSAELLAAYVAPLVATLPSPYREAITLTELEGLSQVDAAAMLGVPLSTMRSRVQRGRARLRDLIDRCCKVATDARGKVIDCEPRTSRDGTSSCQCGPTVPAPGRSHADP